MDGAASVFTIGARLGGRALRRPWLRRLDGPRVAGWIERRLRRHTALAAMAARHLAGVRPPAFLAAGMGGLGLRCFSVADGVSALAGIRRVFLTGCRFGALLPRVEAGPSALPHLVAAGSLRVGPAVAAVALIRRRRKASEADRAGAGAERESGAAGLSGRPWRGTSPRSPRSEPSPRGRRRRSRGAACSGPGCRVMETRVGTEDPISYPR